MSSDIHTDQDSSVIRVVFTGGNISVGGAAGSVNDKPAVMIRLQQLERRATVGLALDRTHQMIGPELRMVFVDPASVDVVIEHLQFAKGKLEEEIVGATKNEIPVRPGRRRRRAGEVNP